MKIIKCSLRKVWTIQKFGLSFRLLNKNKPLALFLYVVAYLPNQKGLNVVFHPNLQIVVFSLDQCMHYISHRRVRQRQPQLRVFSNYPFQLHVLLFHSCQTQQLSWILRSALWKNEPILFFFGWKIVVLLQILRCRSVKNKALYIYSKNITVFEVVLTQHWQANKPNS